MTLEEMLLLLSQHEVRPSFLLDWIQSQNKFVFDVKDSKSAVAEGHMTDPRFFSLHFG